MRFITGKISQESHMERMKGGVLFMPIEKLSHVTFLTPETGFVSDSSGRQILVDEIVFNQDELSAITRVMHLLGVSNEENEDRGETEGDAEQADGTLSGTDSGTSVRPDSGADSGT